MFQQLNSFLLLLGICIAIAAWNTPLSWAGPCKITRNVSPCSVEHCAPSAWRDFAVYAREEIECGASPQNAPTIYAANPAGPSKGTVVLVHGLSANPAHMHDIATDLKNNGYNVVVPILTGHGGSDDLLTIYNLIEWKKDLQFAGEIAQKLGGPLYLLGHSTGGVLASIEAASHPGKYKAIVGYDPALNMEGPEGVRFKNICLAAKFWKYPRQIPLLFFKQDEAVFLPDEEPCHLPRVSEPDVIHTLRDLKVELVINKFCGKKFVPSHLRHYNYEWALAGLCALQKATEEVTKVSLKKLPPALLALSYDDDIFGYISKEKMTRAIAEIPGNKVLFSNAPIHGLMVARCSPGFEENMKATLEWLQTHK